MIKLQKPESFYDVFERRGPDAKTTHYCPGCGHGTVHKLIAEAVDDLGVQDRVVLCAPVGCSVFAYYYFDWGCVQAAHGRAPAVGTAVRRVLDDAIVMSYQGDGDLAGIGLGALVHAANRGERMAVFFVNNAIYGMTGGQMAPTTLVGQRTLTTPEGRHVIGEGHPLGMCEIVSALKAPVYVERVSLGDAGRVMKARKAIRKALQNQVERRGFSFVELLSPCPINWKMPPLEARKWLIENLEPAFPVRCFRDESADAEPAPPAPVRPDDEAILDLFRSEKGDDFAVPARSAPLEDQLVKIAGFGGQGVMSAGILLSNCVIAEGVHATWLPSYGPEMRGGTAYSSVVVSQEPIGSPVVQHPNVLIAMNGPSLDAFEDAVEPGGLIVVNSSLVQRRVKRSDVRAVHLPVSEIARDAGAIQAAAMVALGVYAAISGVFAIDTLRKVIPLSLKKKALVDVNLRALDAGIAAFRALPAGG